MDIPVGRAHTRSRDGQSSELRGDAAADPASFVYIYHMITVEQAGYELQSNFSLAKLLIGKVAKRIRFWDRRPEADIQSKVKAVPPLSLCKFFLMLTACEFAAAVHIANYGIHFIPNIAAIIVPERAGEVTLQLLAAFFLSGVTTVYWGDLTDKWKDFRGLFIGLSAALLVCSFSTWVLVRYHVELGAQLSLRIFAVISTLIGTACIGIINITYNLCAIYALAYPQFSTTFTSLVSAHEARQKAWVMRVLFILRPRLCRAVQHASATLLTDMRVLFILRPRLRRAVRRASVTLLTDMDTHAGDCSLRPRSVCRQHVHFSHTAQS